MPRYTKRSSFLKELRRLDKVNKVVQETSWDDTNVSYNVGERKKTEITTSVNSFVGEIESVEDNSRPDDILDQLERLAEVSAHGTPQLNMYRLIQILDERTYGYPEVGDIFTFVYKAKTPGLIYDLHPVTKISDWIDSNSRYGKRYRAGFYGWNYHLNMFRHYKAERNWVLSNFYKILPEELDTVLRIRTRLLLRA